ncbi:MAG: class I SAM-dependent methyltransferase [Gammaproteobacteria bacterium]|nr:class I SAM-dependent methyltransferase [Gammaproteobacteria bacterium]
MLFNHAPEKFWNLISSKYAASPIADRSAYETKITRLKTYLTPDMSVLDIGCATGTQCGDIASNVKQVTGIDISSKLLAIAEKRMAERNLTNVELLRTSIFDKTFQPGSLDVVMAFFVLHFFEDIDAVFKRVHELLKPGGIFISETACLGNKNKLMGGLLRSAGRLGLLPKINLLTTQQLEQSLARAGFSIVEKTRFSERSDAEFTLVAQKALSE